MSRLTERKIDRYGNKYIATCGGAYFEDESVYKALDELAHYEDLEEQGRLTELPCKVGDTAWTYTVSHGKYEIYDVEVVHEVFATHIKRLWGDRYFATKEEAEAKLAELKGTEE